MRVLRGKKPASTKPTDDPEASAVDRLISRIAAVGKTDEERARAAALFAKRAPIPYSGKGIRVLVVEDDLGFRVRLVEAADGLNESSPNHIELVGLDPRNASDVVDALSAALAAQNPFDMILLDYGLRGDLKATDVVAAIDACDSDELRYLPRAAITHESYTAALSDKLLSVGIDSLYFQKGAHANSDLTQTDASALLAHLYRGDYQEMRARAWGRAWREIRNSIERIIDEQRDAPCTDFGEYKALLTTVWVPVQNVLMGGRYAERANLRVFQGENLLSIRPDPALTEIDRETIRWSQLPYVKRWLERANPENLQGNVSNALEQFSTPSLTRADIADKPLFNLIEGKRALGMPLFTRHGPLGIFTVIRAASDPVFGPTDWEQLQTASLRLAAYAQDLFARWQQHLRVQGLLDLHSRLTTQSGDANAYKVVAEYLYEALFTRPPGFGGSSVMKSSDFEQDSGRITLRWIDAIHHYPGVGVVDANGQASDLSELQRRSTDPLTINEIFESGNARFTINATQELTGYRPPANFEENHPYALMQAPVLVDSVCVAVIAAGFPQAGYFGKSDSNSEDFRLIQDCAALLGQQLQRNRSASLEQATLDLLIDVGSDQQNGHLLWLDKIVELLNNYSVGCKTALWLEPSSNVSVSYPTVPGNAAWRVSRVWKRSVTAESAAKFEVGDESLKRDWQVAIENKWLETYAWRTISDRSALAHYTADSEKFVTDNSMGGETKALLNIRIAHDACESTSSLLVFLFVVPKALNIEIQKTVFDRIAKLCFRYLNDRTSLLMAKERATVAQNERRLAAAYQQMRHSLRSKIGKIERNIDKVLENAQEGDNVVRQLHATIQKVLFGMSRTLASSAALVRAEPDKKWTAWTAWQASIASSMRERAQSLDVELVFDDALAEFNWDATAMAFVLANLIDNALDAFELELRSMVEPGRWIHINLESPDPNQPFRIFIANNGPAIHGDVLDKLFIQGTTNKPEGSGFQLYFSRYLVEREGSGWSLNFDGSKSKIDGASVRFVIQGPSASCRPFLITDEAQTKMNKE